jgi:hypothetical protein
MVPRDVARHSGGAELRCRLPAGVTAEDHAARVEVDRSWVLELPQGIRQGIACRMVPDCPGPGVPAAQRALLALSQLSLSVVGTNNATQSAPAKHASACKPETGQRGAEPW